MRNGFFPDTLTGVQIPAYEWNFGDVNPPVHAWATFRVFKIERKMYGREDLDFLERVFQKLLLNFTWSVTLVRYILRSSNCDAGGSTVKTPTETMSSKEGSLDWITLVFSIVLSHFQPEVLWSKQIPLDGWPFTL